MRGFRRAAIGLSLALVALLALFSLFSRGLVLGCHLIAVIMPWSVTGPDRAGAASRRSR